MFRFRRAPTWTLAFVLAGVSGLGAGSTLADEGSLASQVIFGTSCARCHEGQCSGRLSFERSHEAASVHIQRYAGTQTREAIHELFGHLERMKEDCAYARMDVTVPADHNWGPEALGRLCNAELRSCFVPLGELAPRGYRVALTFEDAPHVHAEIVTQTFETPLEQVLVIRDGSALASFTILERARHFLRLRGDAPIRLRRLQLQAERGDQAQDSSP